MLFIVSILWGLLRVWQCHALNENQKQNKNKDKFFNWKFVEKLCVKAHRQNLFGTVPNFMCPATLCPIVGISTHFHNCKQSKCCSPHSGTCFDLQLNQINKVAQNENCNLHSNATKLIRMMLTYKIQVLLSFIDAKCQITPYSTHNGHVQCTRALYANM